MSIIFIEPKGYYYAYMMPYWVPIFMETSKMECNGPDADGFAGGRGRVWCGCQARAFSGVEL
ncbi:hypothetical protein IEQ34_000629 [Dendrobium chrysotoxum]|uniref:Uncharacterized protein n=1 Tax=Dendrobium chrysotoxum TaxID=161865 RepID=A0AAV7HPK6_DENCH|nr:hypothetical protein IEQ34_000629 [Dendrobium chrysotoxum]